jgi:hypothetical protein
MLGRSPSCAPLLFNLSSDSSPGQLRVRLRGFGCDNALLRGKKQDQNALSAREPAMISTPVNIGQGEMMQIAASAGGASSAPTDSRQIHCLHTPQPVISTG